MIEKQRQTDKHREQSFTGSSVIGWWEYEAALRVNRVSRVKKKVYKNNRKMQLAVEHNGAALNSLIQKYALIFHFYYFLLPGLRRSPAFISRVTETSCS